MNIIETVKLTKKFGNFIANNEITLLIEKGKITAIMGENGAGKTTLMNMFFGMSIPTSGDIIIKGQKVNFKTPQDAIKHGLGMVHQHFKLVPSLTVFENILLGTEINGKIFTEKLKSPFINFKKEISEVQNLIEKYKFDLSAESIVENISIGAKQRVEILKMLYRNADTLIFDEPTAVLTPQEVDELLISFKELKKQGKTIILITHKLREVMEVSDKVIVIKSGKIVGGMDTKDTTPEAIANMMVGRNVVLNVSRKEKDLKNNKTIYSVKNLETQNDFGKTVLSNINFKIKKGEILGVAGVEGNGQSELVRVLTGLMKSTSGSVSLDGRDITNKWPDKLRESFLAFIPEDRYAQGLCKDMSLSHNIIAGYQGEKKYCKNGLLNTKNINNVRDMLIKLFDIRIAEKEGNVSQLSGGNAQKVIIAREFNADPKVLIASQPTRGVDIGSIEFIYSKILELRDKGKAILLVSSELSEIMSLSDRIIVMYKGKIVGEINGKDATTSELGLLMAGVTNNSEKGVG